VTTQRASASLGRPSSLPMLIPAVLGLLISTYLTIEHYTSSALLACPESSTINCAKVTTSSYSKVAGVPVAVGGLAFFVVMTLVCLPPLWRRAELDLPRLIAAGVGVLVALYLVWVELFRLDAICLWCTGTHICALAMFAGALWVTYRSIPV
jgi:uncharacterized membrane protein